MGVLSWLKKSITGRGRRDTRKGLRLTYDAAAWGPESARHWRGADDLSPDYALSESVRRTIANRARYEIANGGYVAGILDTLALHVVGTGPRLELTPADEVPENARESFRAALDRREKRWRDWAAAVDLANVLKMARRARCSDGEVFFVRGLRPELAAPVRLFYTLYEAQQVCNPDYVGTPAQNSAGNTVAVDGIQYAADGAPLRYYICRDYQTGDRAQGQWLAAVNVIHYAHFTRPGQHRGVSELAPTLCVFNDIRRYCNAVLKCAEIGAEISFLVETDNAPLDSDGNSTLYQPQGAEALDFERGAGIFLPAGWKAAQLKSEQPTTQYPDFVRAKVREAARALSMPLSIALGDSSGYNYASGRLDHQIYFRRVNADRAEIERLILSRMLADFSALDAAAHPGDYAYTASAQWMWDGFEHIDPLKEAQASAARMAAGMSSLAQECAKEGLDWAAVAAQRAREKELLERLGLGAEVAAPAPVDDNERAQDEEQ